MFRASHIAAKVPVGALAAAMILSGVSPAWAASDEDLAAIRSAISKLREDYEAKIKGLEDRLQKAETETAAAKASAAAAESAAQEAQKNTVAQAAPPQPIPEPLPAPRQPQSQNAFNPAIAAVLNGFFVAASHDPTAAQIPGFSLGPASPPISTPSRLAGSIFRSARKTPSASKKPISRPRLWERGSPSGPGGSFRASPI